MVNAVEKLHFEFQSLYAGICKRGFFFPYNYMRVRNVNTNPNVDIYDVLDRFTASNVFLSFPLHSSVLCVVKEKEKSPHVCSSMVVHMSNCSIIFAFCCLFTVIFLLYNKSFIQLMLLLLFLCFASAQMGNFGPRRIK